MSDGGQRSSVDHVLASVDRGSAIGDQEGDEFGDFRGTAGAPDWDAAERVHQTATRGFLVDPVLLREAEDESMRCLRFDESGRHRVDTNSLRSDLLRQSLAVGRQRRFGGRVRQGRIEQRETALN